MKHAAPLKSLVFERQFGGVGGDDLDVRGIGEAGSHGVRQIGIDLHASHTVHTPAQQLGRVPSTGPDLEHVRAKVDVLERPGRNLGDLPRP